MSRIKRDPNEIDFSPREELDNVQKIFLLLLDAKNGEPIPGNLWLQKEVFQIAKNLEPLERYLEYEPNVQGPFSEDVKNIVDDLQYLGFVKKKGRSLEITEYGKQIADKIKKKAKKDLLKLVEDVKKFMNDLSKEELLLYIYSSYPEMKEESLEKEEVNQRRKDIAKKLYENGKVSIEKASELAGVTISQFRGLISD